MIERSESMSGAGEAGANLSDLLCNRNINPTGKPKWHKDTLYIARI